MASTLHLLGKRFGDFQLLRELSTGSVARVYLASDGRRVKAAKFFPPSHRNRAERELSFGGGLDHPNLNPVEALVEVEGNPGVTMPFLDGQRLGRWLQQRPRIETFLNRFMDLLRALGHLHGRGIIHRDVKPENIIVAEGRAHLFDFDLSVRVGESHRRRTLVGTVAYLSPEQARAAAVGPWSDLYSAGIILYRGLTGEVPFSGRAEEVVAAHRSVEPRPAREFDRSLEPFEPLLAKLLAKDPGDRFRAAAEAERQLSELIAQLAR